MSHFKIGLRTIKTAISVFICLIIMHLLNRESPVLACLAVVYCLRTDNNSTINFSIHRLVGTFIGVGVSLLAIFAQQQLGNHIIMKALIGSFGIILVIVFSNIFKRPEGIVSGSSTFLIICFNTPFTETFGYATTRLLDVVIGATIAIIINYLLPPK